MNGKNPTRKQKIALKAAGLVDKNWLVYQIDHKMQRLYIMHRETDTKRVIPL